MNTRLKKQIIWGIIIVGSLAYLLNLGFGIVEFIPGNTPLIGDIDEAGATALIIKGLRNGFGVDLLK